MNNQRKLIHKEIKELKARAEERLKWLHENIDSPNWSEVKRDYNAIVFKIDTKEEYLKNMDKHSSSPTGCITIPYNTNLKR